MAGTDLLNFDPMAFSLSAHFLYRLTALSSRLPRNCRIVLLIIFVSSARMHAISQTTASRIRNRSHGTNLVDVRRFRTSA
jgi:hypothetical protein